MAQMIADYTDKDGETLSVPAAPICAICGKCKKGFSVLLWFSKESIDFFISMA
jgi:hypothetical protein